MRESIRAQAYRDRDAVAGLPRLVVGESRAGHRGAVLYLDAPQVVLDAETLERLGIDLQIRASYLRGVRPPAGPEPDPTPGPDDVPLIPEESTHGR